MVSKTHEWGTQPEMFGPRHEYRLGIILREVDRLPRGSRVLDAAVGLGQLAGRMQQRGYDVVGIDYSFEAALHVRKTLGIPAVIGDLTKLPFRSNAFAGVTTGETLEHLDDDASAVGELARVLDAGGTCVATVPALQSLWTASDDYYEHRRRYTRDQLTSLFRAVSMRIEKASFWGFPIVLVYDTLVILPMNKRRARMAIDDDAALRSVARAGRSRMLVNAVRAIFSLDRLFSFVPFGPGLLLVARKVSDHEHRCEERSAHEHDDHRPASARQEYGFDRSPHGTARVEPPLRDEEIDEEYPDGVRAAVSVVVMGGGDCPMAAVEPRYDSQGRCHHSGVSPRFRRIS